MKLPRINIPRHLFTTRRRTIAIVVGLALAALSVVYTWHVSVDMKHEDEMAIEQLKRDERNAVAMWEDILRTINIGGQVVYNPELLNKLAEHTNVPLVIADERLNVWVTNLPEEVVGDRERLREEIMRMSDINKPISVSYGMMRNATLTIYFGTSDYEHLVSSAHSEALVFFPYVQLIIIIIFAIFAYIAFSSTKQNEQNRVWVGLAKETAHQLGTPTSSLLGWIEYLKNQPVDQMAVDEMSKDLAHLMKIVDRFSKIGSETQLTPMNINEVVGDTVLYFRRRIPRNVTLTYNGLAMAPIRVSINAALFEWVIENLMKNSLDALQGQGAIEVVVGESDKSVYVEVSDTGKGIPKSNWTRIFEPGFTTKTRGWGLGLSLSRRIIEEYHRGKIAVVRSEPGRGTTIRVTLKRMDGDE
ncbi:MAG: HAMP domain-containing histidine kinase [Alistipes sp.]|uniref:sensor histidine kinase n=1 Tax=Alistipes sp. TaxID=1872444 RepID=UPI001B61B9A9|nr:HAMP domain-containing histidine kinase [Alistipes sp.]